MPSVYLAAWPRYIKVGYSEDPKRRVQELSRPSVQRIARAPADLTGAGELIGTIRGAGREVERILHALLEEDAVGHEWFRRGSAAERAVRVFGTWPYAWRDFDPDAVPVF